MPGGEVELRYFTVPCHTPLDGRQAIDVAPKNAPRSASAEEVPLERMIRLINISINDLSSFPQSLMG